MPMVVLSLIRLTDDKINLGQKYYSSLYTIVTNERQLFKYMVFLGGEGVILNVPQVFP